MAKRPVPPKWQTVTLFFSGLAGICFETALNARTGRDVNYALIGGFLGMMGLGPILNRSRKDDHDDNDDAL